MIRYIYKELVDMGKKKVVYKAAFIDNQSSALLKQYEGDKHLQKKVDNQHITFEFGPSQAFPQEVMDREFDFKVVAFGNDGMNSGFVVELPEELEEYYSGQGVVHITTSIHPDAKPINTATLDFEDIEPFVIRGKLGYYVSGARIFLENNAEFVFKNS
jgi:hypothetical protein